jgi:hypothetical protein
MSLAEAFLSRGLEELPYRRKQGSSGERSSLVLARHGGTASDFSRIPALLPQRVLPYAVSIVSQNQQHLRLAGR